MLYSGMFILWSQYIYIVLFVFVWSANVCFVYSFVVAESIVHSCAKASHWIIIHHCFQGEIGIMKLQLFAFRLNNIVN